MNLNEMNIMYEEFRKMKNIAIIPARSGSKGLKDKNIMLLNGMPLMGYSISAAIDSGIFSEVMVSTDSRHYAQIACDCGAQVPFLRSEENSSDSAGSWDVVREVLCSYEDSEVRFDTVCLLQPTSPLREAGDIVNGYETLLMKNVNAVTAVCEADHSPEWMMTLPEDGNMNTFREHFVNRPRQAIEKYYQINGALYIRKIEYTADGPVILHSPETALIMDRKRSIDIDSKDDFEYAEWLLQKGR